MSDLEVFVRQPSEEAMACGCGCYRSVVSLYHHGIPLHLCRQCLVDVRAALKDAYKLYEQGRLSHA